MNIRRTLIGLVALAVLSHLGMAWIKGKVGDRPEHSWDGRQEAAIEEHLKEEG